MNGISEDVLVDLERGCDFQRDLPWSTRDQGERHFIGKCTVNVPRLITEIRRLRAENKELRASYERVDKHAAELSRQREEQADMIRWWNPLYR